ncbi:MarR family winged helix-turn-helix transcriptional regulator [uncultured Methanobrevibacter sp.]|uniref:MarR family winged helix-turn-helix transcriptional regulator n=1 Tax=uncultured Methanobrevibacter sp. TaxID=253161 RepID=UPI0025F4435E|nr:MarR family transcriptional regulator [uncultured Methanobrevibacter sp.]
MAFDNDMPTSPLVSLLYRKQTSYLNDKLKDVNLSSGLYPLLIKAYKNKAISQEELAGELHVNESTVTRNLDKLEKKGLIVKTPEKRKKIVNVTPEGAKIAQKIMNYDEKWDETIKESLTEREFEDFQKLLIKICEELI